MVKSKYKVGNIQDRSWTVSKSNWSSTWWSVSIGLRDVIYKGQSWMVGDGQKINFWTDRWLLERPMVEMSIGELSEGYENLKARDLWTYCIGWDMTIIGPYVTEERKLELAAIVLDTTLVLK